MKMMMMMMMMMFVVVESVDHKKFRTCDNTGFCRRNRNNVPKIKFKASSLESGDEDGTFRAELLPVHVAHGLSHYHPLKMNIEIYDNTVVRARVVEDYTKIQPQRYENPDVLIERRRCDDAKVSRNGEISTVSCRGENVLNVHHDKFRLDLLLEDRVIVSANAREMFYFEQQHQRETNDASEESNQKDHNVEENEPDCEVLDWGEDGKPIYADDCKNKKQETANNQKEDSAAGGEENCDGCFSESFGGHSDSKPHGPMSVGTDISFLGASEVYGIPEHATKMALKSTLCFLCFYYFISLFKLISFINTYTQVREVVMAHTRNRSDFTTSTCSSMSLTCLWHFTARFQ
jgi:mannosyl-oligosaccharide alpha-1,3-glucosidase